MGEECTGIGTGIGSARGPECASLELEAGVYFTDCDNCSEIDAACAVPPDLRHRLRRGDRGGTTGGNVLVLVLVLVLDDEGPAPAPKTTVR